MDRGAHGVSFVFQESKTMKTIKARYDSTCFGCRGFIAAGSTITGHSGEWYHGSGGGQGCTPSGNPRADAEYQRGAREANRYRDNASLMGEDYAAAEELAWELKDGDGW